jgi:hypothetical protein
VTQDDLCTGSVYGSLPWRVSWAMSGRPVERWASTPRPTTAGSGSWTATAPRSSGHGNGDHPAWPMPPVCWSSSAYALGHPGFGPARIAAELAQPRWGAITLSTNGVWRVLRRHGLSTRAKRYGLVAGYAAPLQPQRPAPAPEQHLDVDHPGQLVQLDCFCIGRLAGTKGTVWQDTAIDVASAYTWATLQVTRRNPSAQWTSAPGPHRGRRPG